jgi:hypothetical protein
MRLHIKLVLHTIKTLLSLQNQLYFIVFPETDLQERMIYIKDEDFKFIHICRYNPVARQSNTIIRLNIHS